MRLAYKGIDAFTVNYATCKVAEKNAGSSPPGRTPKSQLAAPQPSTGERWNPPKKDTPAAEGQGEAATRRQEACNHILSQTSYPPEALGGPRERSSDPHPETEPDAPVTVPVSPAEARVSRGLPWGRGLWQQQAWGKSSWKRSPFAPPQSRRCWLTMELMCP